MVVWLWISPLNISFGGAVNSTVDASAVGNKRSNVQHASTLPEIFPMLSVREGRHVALLFQSHNYNLLPCTRQHNTGGKKIP